MPLPELTSQQFRRRDAQRNRDFLNIIQARVSRQPFNVGNEGAVKPRLQA